MNIRECIDRLKGYGYVISVLTQRRRMHRKVYMDGHSLRISLNVDYGTGTGIVTGIECYLLEGRKFGYLLGTTVVYPESIIGRIWAAGIGMADMFSVLSEPEKAVMRFKSMRLEEELNVLEG